MISTKSFEAKGEQETKSTVSEAWAGDLAQTAAPHWVLSKLSRGHWRSRRSEEAWECVWLCLSEVGQSSGWAGSRQGWKVIKSSEERGERWGSEAVLRCLIQVTRRKSEPGDAGEASGNSSTEVCLWPITLLHENRWRLASRLGQCIYTQEGKFHPEELS